MNAPAPDVLGMSLPYPTPLATVDVVLLTLLESVPHVALVRRAADLLPYPGSWALPGGVIHLDEDRSTDDAARRALLEKTGVRCNYLEQLQTFSGPTRDPRGWSLSVAYVALVPSTTLEQSHGQWFPARDVQGLAFDHERIVARALERVRDKVTYSSLALHLLPEQFTLGFAREVHEALAGEPLDKHGFVRRMKALGVLEPVGEPRVAESGMGRPAQYFRIRKDAPELVILE